MTRIVIATYGSEGDTRPFVALAAGLIENGFDVVVCGEQSGAEIAGRHRVPFRAFDGDLQGIMATGEMGAQAVRRSDGGVTGLTVFHRLARRHSDAWVSTLVDEAARSDVVIGSGLATYAAVSAAQATGRRFVGASPVPITPTRAFPSVFAIPGTVPRRMNRLSHQIGARALWTAFRRPTNQAREAHGLEALRFEWTDIPVLYGFSPALLPAPPDWQDKIVVCGDWSLPPSQVWDPPAEVVDFLVEGEPPIYVGFGSMAGFDAADLLGTVIAGLDGRRAIVAGGWAGAQTLDLPDTVLTIERAPHSWLLPRCSLAIHHCGAGTTHAVARAGIPSVPMPFVADQPFWARLLRERGLATRALSWKRLTEDAVRKEVLAAADPGMRAVAESMSIEMADEDGISAAVAALRGA